MRFLIHVPGILVSILLIISPLNAQECKPKKLPKVSFIKPRQFVDSLDVANHWIEVKLKAKGGKKDCYPIDIELKKIITGSSMCSGTESIETEELQIDSKRGRNIFCIQIDEDAANINDNETVTYRIEPKSTAYRLGKVITHKVIFDKEEPIDPNCNSCVRLTSGIDFRFEEKTDPISFYGNLNGFIPNQFDGKFAMEFNVFSNSFTSIDSSKSNRSTENVIESTLGLTGDSMLIVQRYGYKSRENKTVRHSGLNISPMYKLFSRGESSLYSAFIFEGAVISNTTSYSIDTISREIDTIPIGDYERNWRGRGIPSQHKSNILISSLAVALPYHFENSVFDIRLKPGFGYCFYGYSARMTKKRFIMLDITVLEKKIGVTIGGQFRTTYINDLPMVNIYIAKSFKFSKFLNF